MQATTRKHKDNLTKEAEAHILHNWHIISLKSSHMTSGAVTCLLFIHLSVILSMILRASFQERTI